MADETVTHYAKSVYTDPTAIVFFVIGVLQLEDVFDLLVEIGVRPKLITAIVAAGGLFARIFLAQRPVAFIAPMQVKPVPVKKIEPTQPADKT